MGETARSALATSLTYCLPSYPSDASEVKSLDLLAALPTPPHNQTEDVRWAGGGRAGNGDKEWGGQVASFFPSANGRFHIRL